LRWHTIIAHLVQFATEGAGALGFVLALFRIGVIRFSICNAGCHIERWWCSKGFDGEDSAGNLKKGGAGANQKLVCSLYFGARPKRLGGTRPRTSERVRESARTMTRERRHHPLALISPRHRHHNCSTLSPSPYKYPHYTMIVQYSVFSNRVTLLLDKVGLNFCSPFLRPPTLHKIVGSNISLVNERDTKRRDKLKGSFLSIYRPLRVCGVYQPVQIHYLHQMGECSMGDETDQGTQRTIRG
jgi:hypothetical protein